MTGLANLIVSVLLRRDRKIKRSPNCFYLPSIWIFEIATRDKYPCNDGKSNLRSSDLDDKPAHSQSAIFNNRRIPNKGAHLGVLGPIKTLLTGTSGNEKATRKLRFGKSKENKTF